MLIMSTNNYLSDSLSRSYLLQNQMKQQRKKQKAFTKGIKKQEPLPPKTGYKAKSEPTEHLPTIQTMLSIGKDDRPSAAAENFKKVKPFFSSYIIKKQGSRVIHLLFKWGSKEIKSEIFQNIMIHWKELIKSSYALYTIAKVSYDFEFPRLSDDANILQNNPEGALVLENYIRKHPESEKSKQILSKFMSIALRKDEKGFDSQQVLHNLAIKSIEKEYYNLRISKLILRLALPTMVDSEREKCVEFFADKSFVLLNDEEGLKLFILLFNYFDNKQKKIIIKNLKNDTADEANNPIRNLLTQNHFSYIALIKVMTEVDDTVLIGKKVIPEVLNLLPEIDTLHKLTNLFVSLFSPRSNNFNCLGKYEKQVEFTTCKKPEEQRKAEIREYIYSSLVQHLIKPESIQATCTDGGKSRLAIGLIKSMEQDGSNELKTFCSAICKHFLDDLNSRKKNEKSKEIVNIEESLAAHNFGSKLLKIILFMNQPFIDKFCDKFSEIFTSNMAAVLKSKATFILSIIIEKGGRDYLMKEVKNSRVDLNSVLAGKFYKERL